MSTERVEINPDKNNKTLEQSQEDLANQGLNVNTAVTTTVSGTASGSVAAANASSPHPLLQPTMFMNYIIKT